LAAVPGAGAVGIAAAHAPVDAELWVWVGAAGVVLAVHPALRWASTLALVGVLVTITVRTGVSGLPPAAAAGLGVLMLAYLLALDLADPGFDHSVLCEFRDRLLRHEAIERLLARVLGATRESGLLRARGRQRTDSTHVLATVRNLNRVELLAETLRAALNAAAVAAPDWLRIPSPPG